MAVDLPDFERANCLGADPEAFFPKVFSSETGAALRICERCDIRAECAEWAIHYESDGIWGGLYPRDRLAIRRARGIVLDQPHLAFVARG